FNGSTDFTVAPPPAAKIKSHKHASPSLPTLDPIALQQDEAEPPLGIASANISRSTIAVNASWAEPTQPSTLPRKLRLPGDDDAVGIDRRRNMHVVPINQHNLSLDASSHALAGIDAFFSMLAG